MNRQTEELIEAIKELDNAFYEWNCCIMNKDGEFEKRLVLARALGKVNGLAFILEQESKPFSSFQHNEHLYGTENSQG